MELWEITGETRKVGLLGWPLGHSVSPHIQNAAFRAANIDYIYLPLPVEPDVLPQAVAGLKALGFVGVNVTIPHKVAIMKYLDALDESAEMVGAVNTIVICDGNSVGYNTDAEGFINSLYANGVKVAGQNAAILGAGGAARAVVAGLLQHGAATVIIGARDRQKAEELAQRFDPSKVRGVEWNDACWNASLHEADILINSTPTGMFPNVEVMPPVCWECIPPATVVYDVVYNPLITRFMTEAGRHGMKTVGGAGMLVEQGAIAFHLWTGISPLKDVMYQAVEEKLNKNK
ncbi:MAG TPA: shikimate dehydrogenase [Methylomusa anaerophila]|uniref:Shikimate dehydrogenase (NADP(+)) n=1 Tax=Methylomusa anaerophila TaxID=1930071 RepID=A0A348AQH8_9FIRM|nr:shikimate dehydrogenase [Methylomusa anaerophila]BBB93326.1 quinate/shikimate dehydrogenase [Methylomusa anaerophila]HML86843.1 shikimate dehydrogenase [Methylomusa anaerophila]